MSPNFWGPRCCGGGGLITLRMLDSDGNELWTWGEHQMEWSVSYRADGFCLSPEGYVGHVGGILEPDSVGVIDPEGVTVWQSVNTVVNETTNSGLSHPAFDADLNLYAVSGNQMVSYDISGSARWQITLPLTTSRIEGARCRGGSIYVLCNAGLSTIVASYDSDGNLLGQREFYSDFGQFGNRTIHVNSSGNAMVMLQSPTPRIEVLDDTCDTISTIPFTLSSQFYGVFSGVRPQTFDMAELSSGNLACVGTQHYQYNGVRSVAYDLTDDNAIFYPIPGFSVFSTLERYPANSAIDGDGSIYCVDSKRISSGDDDGRTLFRFSEAGTRIYTIRETASGVLGLGTPGVQICAIPGKVLIGSPFRPKTGWTLTPE